MFQHLVAICNVLLAKTATDLVLVPIFGAKKQCTVYILLGLMLQPDLASVH